MSFLGLRLLLYIDYKILAMKIKEMNKWEKLKTVLSRRPGHLAASEKMEVNVMDVLSRIPAGIENEPVSLLCDVFFMGDFFGFKQDMADEFFLIFRYVIQRRKMFLGNQENMDRGFRINIFKNCNQVILINDGGGYFFLP